MSLVSPPVCGEQVKMQEAPIRRQQQVRGGSTKVPRLLHHRRHQQSGAFLVNFNIDVRQYSSSAIFLLNALTKAFTLLNLGHIYEKIFNDGAVFRIFGNQ